MKEGTYQHRVLGALAQRHPHTMSNTALALATGLSFDAVAVALHHLIDRKHVERTAAARRKDRRARITDAGLEAHREAQPKPEKPPAVGRRRLPVVAPETRLVVVRLDDIGAGDRRDECVNYDACLDEFVAAHRKSDPQAKCPHDCPHYVEAPKVHPHFYASSGHSNSDASIYARW